MSEDAHEIDTATARLVRDCRIHSKRLVEELGLREAMRQPSYYPDWMTDTEVLDRWEKDGNSGLRKYYSMEFE